MVRHLKISFVIVLSIMLYSCGSNSSTTKIPVSTQSKEAEDLYHQAFRLNSIFKGDEAKKKLIKHVKIWISIQTSGKMKNKLFPGSQD